LQLSSALKLGIEALSDLKLIWADLKAATLPSFAAILDATKLEKSSVRAVVCLGCDDAGIDPSTTRAAEVGVTDSVQPRK
jgi:hypothetical protein